LRLSRTTVLSISFFGQRFNSAYHNSVDLEDLSSRFFYFH
jgi:hypothetical protein